ncbi:MAG: mechanosensitive ion channel family protein [Methanomassiliicoccales archaeon]
MAGSDGSPLKLVSMAVVALAAVAIILELEHGILPFIDIHDPSGDIGKVAIALVVIAIVYILLHYASRLFERLTVNKVGSHAQAKSMWRLIYYTSWIAILLVLILGLIEVGSLVLSAGLIGAALTFVLQKPLLNILAWGFISYRRLFRIGDRISLGGVKGYVLDIKTMFVEVREFGEWMIGDTFTGRIVQIPNSTVFEGPVYNYTKDFPLIWDQVVNLVTYESDIEKAKHYMLQSAKEVVGKLMSDEYENYRHKLEVRDLEQLLLSGPEIRMEFQDSGVNLHVIYFCPAESRMKVKTAITELIWSRFMEDPDVGIAYPHMELLGKLDIGK